MSIKKTRTAVIGAILASAALAGGLTVAGGAAANAAPATSHGVTVATSNATGQDTETNEGANPASAKSTGATTATTGKADTETHDSAAVGNEVAETPDGNEPAGAEVSNDGPGGHADPAGANVDHQFNGTE